MRARWEALRASFVHAVSTLDASTRFGDLRQRVSMLRRFEHPDAVLAWLRGADGTLDEKDRLLASLVTTAQAAGAGADLAWSLLWLSMWPALDHCYRHRLKHFVREPEELVSLISAAFTTLVGRMDLKKVTRVAATLAKSTDREVLSACMRQWAGEKGRTGLPDDAELEGRMSGRRWRDSPLVVLPNASEETQIASVRTRLRRVVGEGAELLINVGIVGFNTRELADQSGQNHETVRKRYQRAAEKVRRALSHSGAQDGVSFTGPRGPRRRAR